MSVAEFFDYLSHREDTRELARQLAEVYTLRAPAVPTSARAAR